MTRQCNSLQEQKQERERELEAAQEAADDISQKLGEMTRLCNSLQEQKQERERELKAAREAAEFSGQWLPAAALCACDAAGADQSTQTQSDQTDDNAGM